ncbi:hypothetical protein Q5752_000412 [Cryptotrichosporon argae]
MTRRDAQGTHPPATVAEPAPDVDADVETSSEAGPSTLRPAERQAGQGKKKKAGGSGKKGKVFLEDKAGLMHLIDAVTAPKDSAAAAKIGRNRARADAVYAAERDGKGKVSKKAADRGKALDRAKEAIREKEKERRRKKKGGPDADEAKPKKRVGFA